MVCVEGLVCVLREMNSGVWVSRCVARRFIGGEMVCWSDGNGAEGAKLRLGV